VDGLTDVLLEVDAAYSARVIALQKLDVATGALPRLADPADPEAVHDLRVSVRRLRSWLRAYRPWIATPALRRHEKELRRQSRTTSELRDLEVQVAALTALRPTLSRTRQMAADSAITGLGSRLEALSPDVRATMRKEFPPLSKALRRSLSRFSMELREPSAGSGVMRDAAAMLIEGQADRLRVALAQLDSRPDYAKIHRTRIEGKRLRYLLEPLVHTLAGGSGAVAALKEMQDALGELHDSHVLRALLATLGDAGTTLVKVVDSHAQRAYREAASRWFGPRGDPPLAVIAELSGRLRSPASTGVEIERKYLLSSLPARLREVGRESIEQGYIPGREISERLRRVKVTGASKFYRTLKAGRGVARAEWEEEIDGPLFRQLWAATRGRRLRKTRYRLEDAGRTWEIDDFRDRDLVLAEVELDSESVTPALPDWLEPHVVREVTGEDQYVNINLAR
jgi:CHAD domain-containing protein/CYTH domain-containing protein